MTKQTTIEFEVNDKDYIAEVELEVTEENNYGADADGNRGVYRKVLNNFHVKKITTEEEAAVYMSPALWSEIYIKMQELNLGEV